MSKRSAAACHACHRRKIKCDITLRGSPCSACITDDRPESACVPRPNRRIRNRAPLSLCRSQTPPAAEPTQNSQYDVAGGIYVSPASHESSPNESRPLQPLHIVCSDDREVTVSLTAKDISGSFRDVDINLRVDTGHDMDPADLAYLHAKGVFALPTAEVCDRLIQGFFSHIHPWYPVVDAAGFLSKYTSGASSQSDLMLLWSILLAGIECAGSDLVDRAGFSNRQDMAGSYYRCAKILYDMNGLKDKETCTQAMLLFARYHKDFVNRWHAVGTAKWLCQFMMTGFNTTPRYQPRLSPHRKALWVRRWWCCLANDVWQAVNAGWPLNIAPSDCQTSALTVADILADIEILDLTTRQLYLPDTIARIAQHTVSYFRSVVILRTALANANKADDKVPTAAEISTWAGELLVIEQETAQDVAQDMASLDEGLKLTAYRFQIYQAGMRVALLRPYLFHAPSHLASNEKRLWDCELRQMMIAAAAKVTSTFETLIGAQLLSFLGQGPLNALTPVAQYYLIHLISEQDAERRIAQNKFESCIIILEEMQKVDGYAYGFLKIFKDARRSVLQNEEQGPATMGGLNIPTQDQACPDLADLLWKDWDAAMQANWDTLSSL